MADPVLTYNGIGRAEFLPGPGSKVAAYVHSSGAADGMYQGVSDKLYTTLNQGLAQARANKQDIVYVLPGHTENISSADQMSALVAGTRIVGLGRGNDRPKFTWTAATATFLLDVASVTLENMHLVMADTGNNGVTVAAPITVSGTDCAILGCDIDISGDANDRVTIGVTTTAAANNFRFAGNKVIGATAAECTTFLQIVGGDGVEICDNYISVATSAVAVGSVRVLTTASTNMLITGNYIANNKAASEEALTLLASCTGFMDRNNLCVLDNASVALDEDGDVTYGDGNYLANVAGERGKQLGTVSA